MATIAVRVGCEIKEISGLTKSTTCWDVVLALLKEKQLTSEGSESPSGTTENNNGGGGETAESASASSVQKSIKELAPSYVIVENWRGCEKPIPPRTRILNVWQAWGKEQKYVELSLKKSKYIRYRDSGNHISRHQDGKLSEKKEVDPDHYSLHLMSSQQKRKIKRSMKQYHRALLMKRKEDCGAETEELNVQNEKAEENADVKSEKRNGLILSEEKFIDGFLGDPDCLIRQTDRAQLISQGTFDREFCKYRRRNRRGHRTVNLREHKRHQVSHYPYSSQHDKPRSSRRGIKADSKKYRYSTDDTSTASSPSNSSEDENASDADDETSIKVDLRTNAPRRNLPFAVGITEDIYGATTASTDSSTTTSGDSMTSSIGGSTSSETSSGGDYYLPELHRLSYGRAIEAAKAIKSTENSSSKPKKNRFILKPALSLIESFRKSSKGKSNKKNNQTTEKRSPTPELKPKTATQSPENISSTAKSSSRKNSETDQAVERNVPEETGSISAISEADENITAVQSSVTKESEGNITIEDESEDHECKDEIQQSIQSQVIVLRNQRNRLQITDTEIQNIEDDIHSLRTRALGKNYVQDAYLSGFTDSGSNGGMTGLFNGPSIPVTTPWILDCDDADMLERFVKVSEKIVEMQLKIEEYNRKAEIILQDLQEEAWQISPATESSNQGKNNHTKPATFMLGLSDEDNMSEDENGHEILSVTSRKVCTEYAARPENVSDHQFISEFIEVEKARTELEASLNLKLQLEGDMSEVQGKIGTSDTILQKNCEILFDCVRDVATSEEGVPLHIWEEYGELLTTYDMEISNRRLLHELERSEINIGGVDDVPEWNEKENTQYIDATSPNPTSHGGGINHAALQHLPPAPIHENAKFQSRADIVTFAPWTHCEQCKIQSSHDGHVNGIRSHLVSQSRHICSYSKHPPLLSNLPLPTPISSKVNSADKNNKLRETSALSSSLLPMLPIPGELMSPDHHNDSDYEDLPDLTRMGPQENEICNNTDDSGNASAGSTTSFTSSDGSRNSSCDGGSPRPIPTLVDNPCSKQMFGRNCGPRASWRGHFVFPNTFKQNNNQSDQQYQFSPQPPSTNKTKLKKPELLPKPSGFSLKKATVVESKEKEIMIQQQRLIRRNSTGRRKNCIDDASSFSTREVVNSKTTKLKNVSSGFIHPKENNCQGWNRAQTKLQGNDHHQRFNNNYDNDSDTGRSSLHSVDSDQVMFSETLV